MAISMSPTIPVACMHLNSTDTFQFWYLLYIKASSILSMYIFSVLVCVKSKYLSFLDLMLPSPISVINKAIEEDRFDIPDVPMEED